MLHPCEEVFGQSLETFLGPLVAYLKSKDLLNSAQEIDHVCYRVETIEAYLKIVSRMKDRYGKVIADSMISGRPITTILLLEPIYYKEFEISCIELPCPKQGSHYEQGWEHIEVVIGCQGQECVDNKAQLEQFISQHAQSSNYRLEFDKRAINKHINADVSLNVYIDSNTARVIENSNETTNTHKKCSVKFHVRPLYEVCKYELDHAMVDPVPIDYFGCTEENIPLQDLISDIRDSEIENTGNWSSEDIMIPLSADDIKKNKLFQGANIQGHNMEQVLEYIRKCLSRLLVKRNVGKEEYDIHSYVQNNIKEVNTPQIHFYDPARMNGLMIMERVEGKDLATVYGADFDDTPQEVNEKIAMLIKALNEHGIVYHDVTSYILFSGGEICSHSTKRAAACSIGNLWIVDFSHAVRIRS